MAKKSKKVLMLPADFTEELEELRIKLGAKTHSEVIRRGSKLLRKIAGDETSNAEGHAK